MRRAVPLIALVASFAVSAIAQAQPPAQNAPPVAERIGEHRYRMGQVVVDTAAKSVAIPCRVNMSKGMIEYLAVAEEGKRHESVLLVEAEPLHIHLALLLLGLDPGPRPRYQGDPATPVIRSAGDSSATPDPLCSSWVEARVTWQSGGKSVQARLDERAW